jgi:hypothetical protein
MFSWLKSLVALLRILHLPLHPSLLYITNTDSAGISLSTRGTTSKNNKKKRDLVKVQKISKRLISSSEGIGWCCGEGMGEMISD